MGSTSVVVRVVADTKGEAKAAGPWRGAMVSDRVRCVSLSDLFSGAAVECWLLIRFSTKRGYCLLAVSSEVALFRALSLRPTQRSEAGSGCWMK